MGKNCKKVVDLVSIPFAYYTWIQQTHVTKKTVINDTYIGHS